MCAMRKKVNWIHAMGDSQQREFVAIMKMIEGSDGPATGKFENADWIMEMAPNDLRITWQFYVKSFLWTDGSRRDFNNDRVYFDHFNIVPGSVCHTLCFFVTVPVVL